MSNLRTKSIDRQRLHQLCARDVERGADLPHDDDLDISEWLALDQQKFLWRELEARIEAEREDLRLKAYRIQWDVWRQNVLLAASLALIFLWESSHSRPGLVALLSALGSCVAVIRTPRSLGRISEIVASATSETKRVFP